MTADHRPRGLTAFASVADLPYRYLGHLLILTLALLVAFFGGRHRSVNVDALAEASHLFYAEEIESHVTPPPMTIVVPQASPVAPATASIIRVKPRFFITSQDIDRQEVVVVQPTAIPAQVAPAPRPQPITHVVQDGETLGMLAERYGISMETLRSANRLDDPDNLSRGQQLLILPVSGVLHTVREGDTLNDLAARYRVELEAITAYNSLTNADQLIMDDQIIIPGGRLPDPVRARPSARGAATTSIAPAPATVESATAPEPPRSALEVDVANLALEYLGYPYAWGGASPRGFDCSGFVTYVYRQKGVYIPRDLWGMVQTGAQVSRDALRPGDLVFFQNTYTAGLSHVGIYIGGGQFVDAKDEASGVTVSNMNSGYWAPRYYGARRILQ